MTWCTVTERVLSNSELLPHDWCRILADLLIKKSWKLATAESCTGGLIAGTCTDLAGSSTWFERGFVSYSNAAKTDMLGVDAALIARHGAVSAQVVCAMASGALLHSQAQVALAVSGIAGPDGGSVDKPVGTVCLSWATPQGIVSEVQHFPGDRAAVRAATVRRALQGLCQLLV